MKRKLRMNSLWGLHFILIFTEHKMDCLQHLLGTTGTGICAMISISGLYIDWGFRANRGTEDLATIAREPLVASNSKYHRDTKTQPFTCVQWNLEPGFLFQIQQSPQSRAQGFSSPLTLDLLNSVQKYILPRSLDDHLVSKFVWEHLYYNLPLSVTSFFFFFLTILRKKCMESLLYIWLWNFK